MVDILATDEGIDVQSIIRDINKDMNISVDYSRGSKPQSPESNISEFVPDKFDKEPPKKRKYTKRKKRGRPPKNENKNPPKRKERDNDSVSSEKSFTTRESKIRKTNLNMDRGYSYDDNACFLNRVFRYYEVDKIKDGVLYFSKAFLCYDILNQIAIHTQNTEFKFNFDISTSILSVTNSDGLNATISLNEGDQCFSMFEIVKIVKSTSNNVVEFDNNGTILKDNVVLDIMREHKNVAFGNFVFYPNEAIVRIGHVVENNDVKEIVVPVEIKSKYIVEFN